MNAAIDTLLARTRSGLRRVGPSDAVQMVESGDAVLVDIRPVALRDRDGEIPGAWIIDRNVLEWRLDPTSPDSALGVDESFRGRPVIVFCDEGYASSLAAASLQSLGLAGATDLDGGFQAWRAAGLPVSGPNPPAG